MTERSFNLVVPLAHEATAMRITDTCGSRRDRSGAVSPLKIRPGDVESTMGTSPAGPGIRTSTTAIRKLIGIGQHDRLTNEQLAQAKAFGEVKDE